MSARRFAPLLAAWLVSADLAACPWCLTNGIKATVTRETGDLGGRFFGGLPDPKQTRHYFIAAETTPWLYVPQRRDPTKSGPTPRALELNQAVVKLRYFAYTDATFTTRALESERLGMLGPVLRGVVGEYLMVTFQNRTDRPVSLHPHGVKYDKDSEGAYYEPAPGRGAAVAPGATFTYVWQLDRASGPLPGEPSSRAWLYHSHVHGDDEITDGLVGFIVVTDPKRARRDGTPADVDREEAALFLICPKGPAEEELEEELRFMSGSLTNGTPAALVAPAGAGAERRTARGMNNAQVDADGWHTINGYAYGNLPGLEMNEGERVRWYLFGLGSEEDLHTAHWHGARVVEDGRRRTDVVELLPGSMKVADMSADNAGTWLLHCHVGDHMMHGMYATYRVHPRHEAMASRRADEAFFVPSAAPPSLRLQAATNEMLLSKSGLPAALHVTGVMSAPRDFTIAHQPLVVEFGPHTAALKLDERGVASGPGVEFRSLDEHPLGLVLGTQINFELTLTGPHWLPASGTKRKLIEIPVTLRLGPCTHRATLRISP